MGPALILFLEVVAVLFVPFYMLMTSEPHRLTRRERNKSTPTRKPN